MVNETKWQNLRRRSKERFSEEPADIDSRIVGSFKPIKSGPRTLLGTGGSKGLSSKELAYKNVRFAVVQYIKGNTCELSIDDVVKWFDAHYQWVLGRACIDYNRWNALKTFSNVLDTLGSSEQELAYELSKWIFTYSDLGFEEYLEEKFSLSSLKRQWILDALIHDTPAKKSSRSYY